MKMDEINYCEEVVVTEDVSFFVFDDGTIDISVEEFGSVQVTIEQLEGIVSLAKRIRDAK